MIESVRVFILGAGSFMVFLWLGIVVTLIYKRVICSVKTKAVIIELISREASNKKTLEFPVYEYEVFGTRYEIQMQFGYPVGKLSIGDTKEIRVSPHKCDDIYCIDKSVKLFVLGLFIGSIACILLYCILGG